MLQIHYRSNLPRGDYKVYINMRDDIVYAGAVSSCLCQISNKKYCYLLCVLVLCTSQVKMMLLL